MKKITFISLLLPFLAFNQFNKKEVDSLLILAKRIYFSNNYSESLPVFDAFLNLKPNYIHSNTYYFIANAYKNTNEDEKAIFYFNQFVEKSGYSYFKEFNEDSTWIHLRKYKEWNRILSKIKKNEKDRLKNYEKNKALMNLLTQIMEEDQNNRLKIDEFEGKYGRNSTQVDSLWKLISYSDSINQKHVQKILDNHKKWYGPNEIGYENCLSLFLVIQHSDFTLQEKYYDMMRTAVLDEKMDIQSFAMFEDRILLRKGKKQLYGTQFGVFPETGKRFLFPVENPEELNFRRELIGMGAMEYEWEGWSLERYYEELPLVEDLIKK